MENKRGKSGKMKSKIVRGDTLETLKSLKGSSIDMGVTSPPYNKGEKNKGWLVNAVKYKAARDSFKETEYQKKPD